MEKAIVIAIIAIVIFLDSRKIWRISPFKSKLIFCLLVCYICYTGFGYITDKPLPNLQDAVKLAFGNPAKQIDTFLKAKVNPEPKKGEIVVE